MCHQHPLEQVLADIHHLDRMQCIHELKHFDEIPLDFDDAFLAASSLERLRHILMAAVLTVYNRRNRAAS